MLEVGTYGAAVQSRQEANPRDLLKRIVDDEPAISRTELFDEFLEEILDPDNRAYLVTMAQYWFVNNYASMERSRELPRVPAPRPSREEAKAAQAARVEAMRERHQTVIQKTAKLMLLELKMPNDKALKDCTFKEVAKFGGWFTRLAEQGRPGQKVGILSEDQVRLSFKGL